MHSTPQHPGSRCTCETPHVTTGRPGAGLEPTLPTKEYNNTNNRIRAGPRDAPDDNDGAPDDDLLCDALRHDAFHDTLHGTLSGTLRDTPHNDVFRGVPCSTIHHGAQRDDTPPDGRAPAPPDFAAPGERD